MVRPAGEVGKPCCGRRRRQQYSGMKTWIILLVVVVVAWIVWKLLRSMWAESHEKLDALPPPKVRRNWPFPQHVGDRVMWCPILARKVILGEHTREEGDLGTVTAFVDDKPVIAFDERSTTPEITDKWGAARVVPAELDRLRPTSRPSHPKAKKKQRNSRR